MEEFLWINDVRNSMPFFNSKDFENGFIFGVLDNRTCKVYNIRPILNKKTRKLEALIPEELREQSP